MSPCLAREDGGRAKRSVVTKEQMALSSAPSSGVCHNRPRTRASDKIEEDRHFGRLVLSSTTVAGCRSVPWRCVHCRRTCRGKFLSMSFWCGSCPASEVMKDWNELSTATAQTRTKNVYLFADCHHPVSSRMCSEQPSPCHLHCRPSHLMILKRSGCALHPLVFVTALSPPPPLYRSWFHCHCKPVVIRETCKVVAPSVDEPL